MKFRRAAELMPSRRASRILLSSKMCRFAVEQPVIRSSTGWRKSCRKRARKSRENGKS